MQAQHSLKKFNFSETAFFIGKNNSGRIFLSSSNCLIVTLIKIYFKKQYQGYWDL